MLVPAWAARRLVGPLDAAKGSPGSTGAHGEPLLRAAEFDKSVGPGTRCGIDPVGLGGDAHVGYLIGERRLVHGDLGFCMYQEPISGSVAASITSWETLPSVP